MLGISFTEFLIIGVVALLALGPQKLPQLLKTVGKAMREFRRATRELRDQLDVDGTIREAMGEPPLRRPAPVIKAPSRIYPSEGVDSDGVLDEPADSPYPDSVPYSTHESMSAIDPTPSPAVAAALDAIPRSLGLRAGEPPGPAEAPPPEPTPKPTPPGRSVPEPAPSRPPGPGPLPGPAPPSPAPPTPTPPGDPVPVPEKAGDDLDFGWTDGGSPLIAALSLAPRISSLGSPDEPTKVERPSGKSQRWRKNKKGKSAKATAPEPGAEPETKTTTEPGEASSTPETPRKRRRR